MQNVAEQIICKILASQMGLDPKNQIWIRNQTRKIPDTDGLFVVVGFIDAQYQTSQQEIQQNEIAGPDDVPILQQVEVTNVQLRENIQIDVFSRDNSALMRHWEVLAALVSIKSVQLQEENSFKIFRQSQSFLNTSSAEGGSNLNRFSITIPCFVWYRKERVLTETGGDYYDDFTTRVDDAISIEQPEGLFSFRITPEGIDPS